MADTSIRVSEELADELYSRKGRSTSYEEFIWSLLDDVDGESAEGGERTSGPVDIEPVVEPSDYTIGQVVENARAEWADDPDQRRQARVDSLRAAIEAVCEEPLSKSELQARAYPGESVGQNERTWFRKTVKPYLKEVAEYSNSDQKWHYSGELLE